MFRAPAPDWVSFDAQKTGGLDLLGLRAPVQSIGNQLFNGVTTITPKLRYISVITWIVWRYAQARLPDERSSFMTFAASQEAAVVLANRIADRSGNSLVGVDEADKLLDSGKSRLLLKRLAKNLALNAYISSTRQLFLTKVTDSGLNAFSEERGQALAVEFDKSIRASAYGAKLAKKPRIDSVSSAELKDLSAKVSLEKVPRGERELLLRIILPDAPVDPAERRRLENYTLLLWLARAKKAFVEEADIFSTAQVRPPNLPSSLHAITDGWLGYVVRDLLAVCHEAVFAAVMTEVEAATAARKSPARSAEAVAALVQNTEAKDEVLREFKLLRKGESITQLTFGAVHERVQRACSKQLQVSNGLRRWEGGVSDTTVYEMAQTSRDAAVALLPIAWSLVAHRIDPASEATPLQRDILHVGGFYQIGIFDVVLPKVAEFIEMKRSYTEVMAELIHRSVQQHLRVAWTRFSAPRGKDVSVLTADMETWSCSAEFRPGRTASRLWEAMSWLDQLGLTDENGPTARGEQILQRALKVLARR